MVLQMMEIQHNITYLLIAAPCTECTVYSVNSRPTRTQLVFEILKQYYIHTIQQA